MGAYYARAVAAMRITKARRRRKRLVFIVDKVKRPPHRDGL